MKFFEKNVIEGGFNFKFVFVVLASLLFIDIFMGSATLINIGNGIKVLGIIISMYLYYLTSKIEIILNSGVEPLSKVTPNVLKSIFSFDLKLKELKIKKNLKNNN